MDLVILCTRSESSRLSRKVLRPIAGVRVLDHILNRLRQTGLPIIVAKPEGDHAIHVDARDRVYVYSGQGASPLHRMVAAAGWFMRSSNGMGPVEYVVRVTHDDMLIDPSTVIELLAAARAAKAGYAITPEIVEGAGVEVIAWENLRDAAEQNGNPVEHVSYYVKDAPNSVRLRHAVRSGINRRYRLTLDYPEDALVLETILRATGPAASLDDVVAYVDRHPWIMGWNHQPTLTFYTCVYNGARYISQTVASVLSNGYPDFEYIVVDDGSTDATLTEVARHAHSPRLRVSVNPLNVGLASSSNVALSMARGRYVMRVDADDLLIPGAPERMLRTIEQAQAAAVYPAYIEVDGDAEPLNRTPGGSAVSGEVNHHAGCAMMDKRLLNEVRFRDGLRHWDSLELSRRLRERFPICYEPQPAFLYRRHANNLSDSQPERRAAIRSALEVLPADGK